MEQLQLPSFLSTMIQSRNAEEALLVVLNACARITQQVSAIEHPDPTAFGAWFKRIQGQRTGPQPCLAAECLSYLDLSNTFLYMGDFYLANLRSSKLGHIGGNYACFNGANLVSADLNNAWLMEADIRYAILIKANLKDAHLDSTNLEGSNLQSANLEGANLESTIVRNANLKFANLNKARLGRKNSKLASKPRTRDNKVIK
jgi:uncharacterized protein YjbI with pentapeptide repeats